MSQAESGLRRTALVTGLSRGIGRAKADQRESGAPSFGRGRIVNISSRGAFRGEPDAPAYAASYLRT